MRCAVSAVLVSVVLLSAIGCAATVPHRERTGVTVHAWYADDYLKNVRDALDEYGDDIERRYLHLVRVSDWLHYPSDNAEQSRTRLAMTNRLLQELVEGDTLVRRYDAAVMLQTPDDLPTRREYVQSYAQLRKGVLVLPPQRMFGQRPRMIHGLLFLGIDAEPELYGDGDGPRTDHLGRSTWNLQCIEHCEAWIWKNRFVFDEDSDFERQAKRVFHGTLMKRSERIRQDMAATDRLEIWTLYRDERLRQHVAILDQWLPKDPDALAFLLEMNLLEQLHEALTQRAMQESLIRRSHPDRDLRRLAMETYDRTSPEKQQKAMAGLLDPEPFYDEMARSLVAELEPAQTLGPHRIRNHVLAEDLITLGAVSVDPLIASMTDREMRYLAAPILVELGRLAVDPLVEALGSADEQLRIGAAMALSRMDDLPNHALQALAEAASDESIGVRMYARRAVAAAGKPAK